MTETMPRSGASWLWLAHRVLRALRALLVQTGCRALLDSPE